MFKSLEAKLSERQLNTIKTTIACFIGIAITLLFHIERPQWILITILVMMMGQPRVGGALEKAYLRFIGTLIGSIIAIISLILLPHNFFIMNGVMLLAIIFFSYLASDPRDFAMIGTLGAVTVVLALDVSNPTLQYALERISEIFVGLVIAILVTRFVLPIHGRIRLIQSYVEVIDLLKSLYSITIIQGRNVSELTEQENPEPKIVDLFYKQRVFFKEAVTEQRRIKFLPEYHLKIIDCERKILRTMYILYRTMTTTKEDFQAFTNDKNFILFNEDIMTAFNQLITVFENLDKPTMILQFNFARLEQALHQLAGEHPIKRVIRIHAFLFCAQQLTFELNNLVQVLSDLAEARINI